MPKTLREIADFVGGELSGAPDVAIKGVGPINEAKEGDLSFILTAKQEGLVASTKASAVLIPADAKAAAGKPVIKVKDPSIALSKAIGLLFPERIPHPGGVHPTAVVSKKASLGKNVGIGAYAVIEAGAAVGDDSVIYPFTYVGKNSKIGKDCLVYPNVTIREEVSIGDRVIIHPGACIGADGFGYDTNALGVHVKVPQLGVVVIEDDVEIGAATTIDRARFAKTVIGRGTKIDNLVQIAHNVTIGPYCLIAAQTGISGSCALGRNVVLGGQVGIADHVKLGDFVMAGAKTGITKSFLRPKTVLFWYPAKPVEKVRDIIASVGLLPKLFERVRALEAKIKDLEKR